MMSRLQVAAYVTPAQKVKLAKLASLDGASLSMMLCRLVDESYDVNFPNEPVEDEDYFKHTNEVAR